jgi:hypothetical protein
MNRTVFLLAATLGLGGAAQADETMMLRAGEWRIVRDGPAPGVQLICYDSDRPLGQMTDRGMNDCVQNRVVTGGTLLTIDAICRTADKLVTVHGTIQSLGVNAYRADSRIRFHHAGQANGADVSIRVIAKRLGPCRPGDVPG